MKRLFLVVFLLTSGAATAGEFMPGTNTGALARGFALPELGQPEILDGARHEIRGLYDITNEFVIEGFSGPGGSCPVGAECVLLDGETSRLLLSYRRGLGGGWDASVDLPLIDQGGGFLDSWIEQWHDWFALPTGARETRPRDQYQYRYVRNNSDQLNVTETYSGFGDLTLGIGRRLTDGIALRGMAKLPTGDDKKLGGGNAGGAVWLDMALPLPEGFHGFAAAGLSVNDRGKVLSGMQNTEVAFGGIGLTTPFPFTDRVRLLAQLHVNSLLYDDSDRSPFSRLAFPLTIGAQIRTGEASRFDFGFQEDLGVNASPDFTAYLALTYAPR